MTPLQARIVAGLEDENLLEHIDTLGSFSYRSPGEDRTLVLCWQRLGYLTSW